MAARARDAHEYEEASLGTCVPSGGKLKHETRGMAQEQADSLTETDGAAMNPYRCPICRYWHVGHVNKGKGRRRRGTTR